MAANDLPSDRSWGDVTDPREHNPNKFRYLVHGINPYARLFIAMIWVIVELERPDAINKEDGDQTVNLFREPERLDERVALSCTLIDQDHSAAWGQIGLIVEAPPGNVSITSPFDTRALTMSKKLLEKQAKGSPMLTTENLLAQTNPSSHNEVVVLANNDGNKVRLAGFFYRVTDNGTPSDELLADKIRQHGVRLNLPVVAISVQNPYKENEVIHKDDSLQVHFNRELCTLRGPKPQRFRMLDQSEIFRFASPDEIESVLGFLEKNGVAKSEITQLRENYVLVDAERQKPKVKYDKDGQVFSIEKRSGYGNSEKVMRVGKHGSTSWVYAVEEIKKFREMLVDPLGPVDSSVRPPSLSPDEVEAIVQEALQSASDADRPKIEKFYQEMKDKIAKLFIFSV